MLIQIAFSAALKNQICFKLNAHKIKFRIVIESDSIAITIDEKDLPIALKICYMIKSDYLIVDSLSAPLSDQNTETFFNETL